MDSLDAIFKPTAVRKIWKKLRDSEVPIVSQDDYDTTIQSTQLLLKRVRTNEYIPSLGHGYLGYPKGIGCTRFVPVLTKEDMAVYYLIVLSMEDFLVHNVEGVYGGWRVVPGAARVRGDIDPLLDRGVTILDPYFSNTFANREWFKNWTRFTDLLSNLTSNKATGNYVISTDIANFYDTIDISQLCQKILAASPRGNEEIIELLKFFLQHWDRRIKGYSPSSKGIPQEMIQDASRILSHFFLRDFDEVFKEHCDNAGIIYTRWADDITLFGNSTSRLERAVYTASQILLKFGLNLNSSKTKLYSRLEYRQYRVLDLLEAIGDNDISGFARCLKAIELSIRTKDARLDTAFRATIGFVFRNRRALSVSVENFIEGLTREYRYLCLLNAGQFNQLVQVSRDPNITVERFATSISRRPYAAAKANYLHFIRKHGLPLGKRGVSNRKLRTLVERIVSQSEDSTLISEFCGPAALRALS